VLARLIKELPLPAVQRLLGAFARGEGGAPSGWSEAQVAHAQAALSRKPPLEADTLRELLHQADANVDALKRSLKFSNLLFTLLRGYGGQLGPQLTVARAVVEQLETFMRKSALAAIARLES